MKKVKSFLGGLVAVVILLISLTFTGCKEDPIIPEGGLATVSFKPVLSGTTDPVPWLQPRLKSFGEFEHKYANHIIRIFRLGATIYDDWYMDIPIVNNADTAYDYITQSFTINIAFGAFSAEVIPVADTLTGIRTALNGDTQYALTNPFPITQTGIQREAVFYTRMPEMFNITPGTTNNTIILNCITDLACILINFNDAIAADVLPWAPTGQEYNISLFTGLNPYGDALVAWPNIINTIPTLDTVPNHGSGMIVGDAAFSDNFGRMLGLDQVNNWQTLTANPTDESTNLWYDATSHCYYAYFVPGMAYDRWNGNSTTFDRGFINQPFTLYEPIGTEQGRTNSPSYLWAIGKWWDFPLTWVRDYFTTAPVATLFSNMVCRVSFSSSAELIVNQGNWFETGIDVTAGN